MRISILNINSLHLKFFATTFTLALSFVSAHGAGVYVGSQAGYGVVEGAYAGDGDSVLGRFFLGVNAYEFSQFSLGAELGFESGNTMRLATSVLDSERLGGLQPLAVLKPWVDFLITVKAPLLKNLPIFSLLKAGIAYRQLQLETGTSNSDHVDSVDAELQAGIGYQIRKHAWLTAVYQGVYSANNAGVTTDASGNNTYINRVPTQQAGMLGFEYVF